MQVLYSDKLREAMEAFKDMKIGKAPGLFKELILGNGYVGIGVLMEHCQIILDRKGSIA